MVKVSIVIPVYNRKNFLTVCIKSLLAQSFEDFEICLVDDGSTDGTGLLCDELAEKDTRIRVLHVQNGGATYARQKGVELATGEWVLFVDSDDTMPADALQRLFQAASEDTDIVVGFYRKKRLWGVNKLSPACYRKLLIKGRHNISATCGKVIPVYNRKNFLTVCIKSLLAQSFEDFEICLVDDGSTDGTGLLCDELAEKDTRIRVLHVQNGGATYARQKGVELATGEWVLFVDSDDTMPADALQRLFQAASEDTDIVVGFYRKKRLWGVNKLSPACYRKLLIKGRHNISATCGKLFRRTLFDEDTLRTPREIVMGEDMLMNLRLAFASSKPVRLVGGNSVYNYIQHGGNITHVFKLTADYEHIFHKERLQAIPEEEHARYMPVMIYRRLRMLRRILRCAQKDNTVGELRTSVFVKELIADIHATRYAFWRYPHWRLWRFLASAGK